MDLRVALVSASCFLVPVQPLFAQDDGVEAIVVINRELPAYPAHCDSQLEDGDATVSATVIYRLSATGRIQDSRVREGANACVEMTALDAMRRWDFEPKIPSRQWTYSREFEADFFFTPQEETEVLDYEVVGILKSPPRYPDKCMSRAKPEETIRIGFDINEEGAVENAEVLSSTNRCLNQAAISNVETWLYEPKRVDGAALRRNGMEAVVTFSLSY